jgi:Ni/Fe-hydrogenase subunit HybB-like protein
MEAMPAEKCAEVTSRISGLVLREPMRRGWVFGFVIACGLLTLLCVAVTWLLIRGVGIWGVNMPVAWGFAIVNFVWWVGIGHAGTFISAILLLLHQQWRTSINRFTEAMTIFAVACAGLFPLLHLGRPWAFYWLLPYPDTMDLWPQWRSPLVWDVFAVSTYLAVSLLFWFVGLMPDLAVMRDNAQRPWVRRLYGIGALGWRNSARHWKRHETACLLLAGLATPLVLSVHSVVSLDFSATIVPGWHSTIFPPYFVAGAIFSGFAMVLTLLIPVRAVYGLRDIITERHLDNAAKVMLATGWMVALGYASEHWMSWYSDDLYEGFLVHNRMSGAASGIWWLVMICNIGVAQALWWRRVRTSPLLLFITAFFIQIGMWSERYLIVVTSLARDFMPSAWADFHATFWDWATLAGSMGLFFTLLFLFIRLLPMIAIHELRREAVQEGGGQP